MEKLTNIYIDDYMVVDFAGLKNMVDALGGVGVYVSEDIDDPEYTQLKLEKGCHHLDGSAAIMYARVRHGVSDGSDLHRIERQQNLMGAMMRTAMRKNLLTSTPDAGHTNHLPTCGSAKHSGRFGYECAHHWFWGHRVHHRP